VCERADQNARRLLDEVKNVLNSELQGLLRIQWQRFSRDNWQIYGALYMARGPKRKIGTTGFNIGSGQESFRLIGWTRSFGGLNGLEQLAVASSKKNPLVHLASEYPNWYPGWVGGDNVVVWLDQKLNGKTSHESLQNEIARKAMPFFKVARPLLRRLAG
jgi:hypothetical protein